MEETYFAPAARASEVQIREDTQRLTDDGLLETLFQAVSDIVLVLNAQRQIVFYNLNLLETVGLQPGSKVCGLRPGEALGCIHAGETDAGCGTTEFCRECGAVQAILAAQAGQTSVRECRILREGAEALDLMVKATPYPRGGEVYTVFSIQDISHEKRRKALERIFFHDVLNAAGGIQGLSELLPQTPTTDWAQIADLLQASAESLVGEIRTQRELSEAENNELILHPRTVSFQELVETVRAIYRNHPVAEGKTVAAGAGEGHLVTDPVLVARILGNLVKNALEASPAGAEVTVRGEARGGHPEFTVHNPGAMPAEVQHQLFQRSFSTKGRDRGLGTYSVKLLAERYLGGRVSFESTPDRGTTFRVELP